MKTPREILLEKHEAAQAKLNALRREVLGELPARQHRPWFHPNTVAMKLWAELFQPYRRIWAGLAALWVAIAIFNTATSQRAMVVVTENSQPPTPEVVAVLKDQRQMLAQLLDSSMPIVVSPRRNPGPRSEQRQAVMMA